MSKLELSGIAAGPEEREDGGQTISVVICGDLPRERSILILGGKR